MVKGKPVPLDNLGQIPAIAETAIGIHQNQLNPVAVWPTARKSLKVPIIVDWVRESMSPENIFRADKGFAVSNG